jgi:hypothetical protein
MVSIKPKNNCPLNKFEPCKELDCSWFIQLRGTDPNSGKEIDEWGCAVAWMPMLLIENSQQSRQTGAAVESFRNEFVKEQQNLVVSLTDAAKDSNVLQIKKTG